MARGASGARGAGMARGACGAGMGPSGGPLPPRWPRPNAAEFSQAAKLSSSRHRVTTSQVVRSSVGLSSSNPSNPSWLSTAPARAANRRASSSPLSAGTVIALILITVIRPMMPAGGNPVTAGQPATCR